MDGHDAEDAALLAAAAREAGALAMRYFGRDLKTWTKEADSPVSEADIAVDVMLAEKLRAARPDYGWLSEESLDDLERLQCRRLFVVDPIDGTRAFIAGRPQWAVSLAVAEEGRPVAAALEVPVLKESFVAQSGAGTSRNGRLLRIAARSDLAGVRIAGPRRYARTLAASAGVPVSTIRFVPSLAYRVALVAAGEVDIAIARPGAHDWDLAAADLLVHEAGGTLVGLTGEQLRYNKADPTHPALVAAPPSLCDEAVALVAEASRDIAGSAA